MVLGRAALNKSKDRLATVKEAVLSGAAREERTPLQLLRHNPDAAMEKFAFFVDIGGFTTAQKGGGGAVSLKEGANQNGVTCLTIEAGGNDFYFPWVPSGVGEVIVPIKPDDGTIVVTGGMNGCTLQVNKDANHYYFYHDADGKYLGNLGPLPGKMVCHIGAASYYDDAYIESLYPKPTAPPSEYWAPLLQMICVRSSGKWKVMCWGIKIHNGKPTGCFRPFKRGVQHSLLRTFA
jgi:hypothetical protein